MSEELCAAWNNYGLYFLQQHDWKQAGEAFAIAVACDPHCAPAQYNLGIALEQQAQLDQAVACYRQAVQLHPDYPEAWHNLGTSLSKQEHYEEAAHAFRQAIRCSPNYAKAHCGLGYALFELGRFDEACGSFREAIRLGYAEPDAHINLALGLLTLGRLREGWPGYEQRWDYLGTQDLPQPVWDGSPLAGRTILLHAEQGLGDTIQFLRYIPLVKQQGGQVLLACQRELANLARSCAGIDAVVPMTGALPSFDVHAPLLSLPGIFGTSLESIPAEVPYLYANPEQVARWRQEFAEESRFKVGIVWQTRKKARCLRSAPLAAFAPLAGVPNMVLYSLQFGDGSEQVTTVDFPITDLGNRSAPLDNLAAILVNLDLLISVDTAPVHLAGALGVPVWLALPHPPDWRWFLDRADSPWYPTFRLFRQRRTGDWSGVFASMADALRAYREKGIISSLKPGRPCQDEKAAEAC